MRTAACSRFWLTDQRSESQLNENNDRPLWEDWFLFVLLELGLYMQVSETATTKRMNKENATGQLKSKHTNSLAGFSQWRLIVDWRFTQCFLHISCIYLRLQEEIKMWQQSIHLHSHQNFDSNLKTIDHLFTIRLDLIRFE